MTSAQLPMTTGPAEALAAIGGREPATTPVPPRRQRLDGIDLLRGIVMVIMVLDHTRDFAFSGTLHFNPTDLSVTTPAIFFTRWVTHFCAPVFVFLAGTGTYLQRARGKSVSEVSRFLWTRGLWLIVLEFTLVNVGIRFWWDTKFIGAAQVIWVIGISMIILAALIHLPTRAVAALGVAMILLHNAADGIATYQWHGPMSPTPTAVQSIWLLLHGGFQVLPLGHPYPIILVVYAVIPWAGVMAAGYAAGAIYNLEPAARRRALLWLGGSVTASFVVVRAINLYGDPSRWSVQRTPFYTFLSFLNTTKYPPSLEYLLMTLGPSLLLLAWFDRVRPTRLTQPLIVFGRVPLFFYLLQWPTAHALTILASLAANKPIGYLIWRQAGLPESAPPDAGFSLGVTYLIWVTAIVLLYPACAWYARLKQRSRAWWLSYL